MDRQVYGGIFLFYHNHRSFLECLQCVPQIQQVCFSFVIQVPLNVFCGGQLLCLYHEVGSWIKCNIIQNIFKKTLCDYTTINFILTDIGRIIEALLNNILLSLFTNFYPVLVILWQLSVRGYPRHWPVETRDQQVTSQGLNHSTTISLISNKYITVSVYYVM